MFNKPTVVVVGAGASAEFNLPTGTELKSKIGDRLRFRYELGSLASGDPNLLEAIRAHVEGEQRRVNQFTRAGSELAETINTFPSIDEALHWWRARSEIVELGKVAAAYYILESEAQSPLILNRQVGQVDVDAAGDCWLRTFLSIALSAGDRENVETIFNNVTFINFNYDRVIEQYIFFALQQRAGVSSQVAAKIVSALKIIRPYGTIGKLDWIGQHEVSYGFRPARNMFSVAKNVRTFTEQTADNKILQDIDGALENARLILFLGFGFHQQNLALFRPGPGRRRFEPQTILATTLGLDPRNYDVIQNHLHDVLQLRHARLVPLSARQLLTDLRPTIALAAA